MRGAGRVRNKHVIEKNLIYIGNSLATNKNGANQSVGRNQPCPDEQHLKDCDLSSNGAREIPPDIQTASRDQFHIVS